MKGKQGNIKDNNHTIVITVSLLFGRKDMKFLGKIPVKSLSEGAHHCLLYFLNSFTETIIIDLEQ